MRILVLRWISGNNIICFITIIKFVWIDDYIIVIFILFIFFLYMYSILSFVWLIGFF